MTTDSASTNTGGESDEFASRTTTEDGIEVVAWTVLGGGHAWPGAPVPPEWSEPTTEEFDAAAEICRFAAPLLAPWATRRR